MVTTPAHMRFPRKRTNKYHAKRVIVDGIAFDSEKESKRYLFLKEAQANGEISELELQPQYIILPAIKGERIKHFKRIPDRTEEYAIQQPVKYTADFRYVKDGQTFVEDIKGSKFTISRDLPLRLKMMKYFHNIDVKIIYDHQTPI